MLDLTGRGERIRTSDLTVPNRALYQAEPRPVRQNASWIIGKGANRVKRTLNSRRTKTHTDPSKNLHARNGPSPATADLARNFIDLSRPVPLTITPQHEI
jgi:hypothetical protein